MLRKRNPPSAANAATAITVADENGTDRKNRKSISGSSGAGAHRSRTQRATQRRWRTQPTMKIRRPALVGALNDAVGQKTDRIKITSTCPGRSTFLATGALDSGM